MAGVAAENVSRVMNDWLQRHVVTRSSGYYCLEDIAALKSQVRSYISSFGRQGKTNHPVGARERVVQDPLL